MDNLGLTEGTRGSLRGRIHEHDENLLGYRGKC